MPMKRCASASATALGQIGPAAAEAIPLLTVAIQDSNQVVANAAAAALRCNDPLTIEGFARPYAQSRQVVRVREEPAGGIRRGYNREGTEADHRNTASISVRLSSCRKRRAPATAVRLVVRLQFMARLVDGRHHHGGPIQHGETSRGVRPAAAATLRRLRSSNNRSPPACPRRSSAAAPRAGRPFSFFRANRLFDAALIPV